MNEPTFLMDAESLGSKWGFGDGDALDDWWWDNYGEDPSFNTHRVLYRLVEDHLIPALAEWDIELVLIHTNHNPVRAEKVDGVEIDWGDSGGAFPCRGVVAVTRRQIEAAVDRSHG